MELNLSGIWNLIEDADAKGEAKNWFHSGNFPGESKTIAVPLNLNGPVLGNAKTVWMKKEFHYTGTGSKYKYLVFFGADKGTVWLNEKKAGELKRTLGKQVFDITGILRERNELIIQFEDVRKETAGIWKNVYLMEDTTVPASSKKSVKNGPEWLNKSVIYYIQEEYINKSGGYDGLIKKLSFLKNLGVNTVLFSLGILKPDSSFLRFVENIRKLEMKIILDLPVTGNPEELKEIMKNWMDLYRTDGYRCRNAGEFPDDFWKENINSIRSRKNDFLMLADGDYPGLYSAGFDILLDTCFNGIMDRINSKYYAFEEISNYIYSQFQYYPMNAKRMFSLDKDEISKPAIKISREWQVPFQIIKFFTPGIPMIYSGEEYADSGKTGQDSATEDNRSRFPDIYRNILSLKKKNEPLNEHHMDNFTFRKGLTYFEIIRSSMDKKIHAVFDLIQGNVTIIKNGKKYMTIAGRL